MGLSEVRTTRIDHSDGGLEIRAEVYAGSRVYEFVVCDGMFGETIEVFTGRQKLLDAKWSGDDTMLCVTTNEDADGI